MTSDDQPQKPERCKHGVHGTDCFECFPKPDATPREWYLIRKKDGTLGALERTSQFLGSPEVHVIEKSAYDALSARVAELEGQLKAKVNLDTVFVADAYEQALAAAKAREAKLVALINRIASACGAPDAADACRNILALIKDFKGGG